MLQSLGKTRLLVGAQMEDDVASSTPFDVRYVYLAAGIPNGAGPCASCTSGCATSGDSCVGGGCAWWGCWQDDSLAPGQYVRDHIEKSKSDGQIPMFTYYEFLYASGAAEGPSQVDRISDGTFLSRYLADFRFFLQQVGNETALIHLEPDLWAYGQRRNVNPHTMTAPVASANATDCASQESSFAGLGKCMVAMTRKYAPNAKVALHASAWATAIDVYLNTDPSFDVEAEADKTAAYLAQVGGADADFVVVEASDRDSGYLQSEGEAHAFWDASNQTLPHFAQAFRWVARLSQTLGKANLWWQLPVGNMLLPNTTQRWKDNRVDYFFSHLEDVSNLESFGIAFGSGADDQTNPSTDNGVLAGKVSSYVAGGGQGVCP